MPQFAGKYPAWSQAALRALILNADDRLNTRSERLAGNGLASAILRVGRKVLIDEQAFFAWIVEQQKRRRVA
ncbi:MAG TPA: DNA-binding protein [Casimicrobiaceae bacterium]|nr:DNA-binding protein [Casimicrobiaceae bacterium]